MDRGNIRYNKLSRTRGSSKSEGGIGVLSLSVVRVPYISKDLLGQNIPAWIYCYGSRGCFFFLSPWLHWRLRIEIVKYSPSKGVVSWGVWLLFNILQFLAIKNKQFQGIIETLWDGYCPIRYQNAFPGVVMTIFR